MFGDESKSRKSWQAPRYPVKDNKELHTWLIGQVQDGTAYRDSSPGATQLEESIRILSGKPSDELAQRQDKRNYSKTATNRLKRNLREMINSLAEIRYNPGYHTNSKDIHDLAETLNKYGEHWYMKMFIDLQVKKALQWAAICPCGWLEICYREMIGQGGKRQIDLIPMSWFDVVMTGVPDDGGHQEAYTVTIIKDLPMHIAHGLFPDFQKWIMPDRESPKGWAERVKSRAQEIVNDVFDTTPPKATAKNPTARFYYQYILDLSINKSKSEMKMGYEKKKVKLMDGLEKEEEVETPWSYIVPFVGQEIPMGIADEAGGMKTRKAEPKDCRIFPGRRLAIAQEKCAGPHDGIIYDGPMWDWHGRVPLIKFSADEWVFGEFSMVHDVSPIHEAINEIDRMSHQTLRNRFNPTMGYNNRAIDRGKAKAVDLRVQGDRIGFNGQEATDISKAMGPLVPASFNVIEGWVESFRKYLTDEEDYQMGVRNFEALAKIKTAGASDETQKLLDAAGPIVKGISRDMERSMRDLADMFKYMVIQYIDTPRLMAVLGPDGITPVNFDYEPGNLVPSHLPGENKDKKSVFTRMQRAHWIAEYAEFIMLPGHLHQITQMSHKLMIMQAAKMGLPISWWTLNERLSLGLNLGPRPGNTDIEAWMHQQKMMLEFKASLSAEAQALQGDSTPQHGGEKNQGGRPNIDHKEPKQYTKGDGRNGVKTS